MGDKRYIFEGNKIIVPCTAYNTLHTLSICTYSGRCDAFFPSCCKVIGKVGRKRDRGERGVDPKRVHRGKGGESDPISIFSFVSQQGRKPGIGVGGRVGEAGAGRSPRPSRKALNGSERKGGERGGGRGLSLAALPQIPKDFGAGGEGRRGFSLEAQQR